MLYIGMLTLLQILLLVVLQWAWRRVGVVRVLLRLLAMMLRRRRGCVPLLRRVMCRIGILRSCVVRSSVLWWLLAAIGVAVRLWIAGSAGTGSLRVARIALIALCALNVMLRWLRSA